MARTPLLVRRMLAGIAPALLLACSADTIAAPEKPLLLIAPGGGDAQTGVVGSVLPNPIVVQVTGATSPNDQLVNFVVTAGDGSVFAPVVASGTPRSGPWEGMRGIAQNTWTLGPRVGPQTVEARLVDPRTGATLTEATFHATATAGPAVRLTVAAGDQQTAVAGSAVPTAPAVRVTDQWGNPLNGIAMTFSVTSGGGSITGPATVSTGTDGMAAVEGWTLGTTAGPNTLQAASAQVDAPPVTFTAKGSPGSAARLALVSGNDQTASPGSVLPQPPTVRVIDRLSNGVPNVAVTFTVMSGGGSLDGVGTLTTLTDPTGAASVTWTLGPAAGPNTLQATAVGLQGSPLTFTATAAAPPSNKPLYVANSGNNSITVYAAGASGDAMPTATIAGSNTGLSLPHGVALDGAGKIYVANMNNNSVRVYAAGANGDATPTAIIGGSNTRLRRPVGIALDRVGNVYVANRGNIGVIPPEFPSVTVYAAGASGNVTPMTTITDFNTGLSSPEGIAVDGGGKIYVSNLGNNSITVYAAGASGNATPMATIAGSSTGLNRPQGIALDGAGKIYVANMNNNSVTVYAAGASGDATPTATIAGTNAGLEGPAGIALDAGMIYVANLNSNSITVHAPGANGNATPTAIIQGGNTGLSQPDLIAF